MTVGPTSRFILEEIGVMPNERVGFNNLIEQMQLINNNNKKQKLKALATLVT